MLCFIPTSETLARYCNVLQLSDSSSALLVLANAIAITALDPDIPGRSVVVRLSPQAIAFWGFFDEAQEARIRPQVSALESVCARLCWISYAQAERDCERLAAQLRKRFGHRELADFHFTAIPRGGLIVLGMLAYVLGLERAQLEAPHPPDAPLVVVDDCAFTGFRFGQFLGRCASTQVIFASLYAHPDLRAAIVAQEPRVLACLSAQDLHDYGPERWDEDYSTWREQRLAQMGEGRYWVGQTEHVCFPWNEPDRSVFNSATGKLEPGWRIVPPELCLKNRLPPGVIPIPVQIQPEGKGPLKPSARVIFGDLEDEIVVGDLESRQTFGLRDSAAEMWRAIVEHGNLEDAAAALAGLYDVEEAILRADLRAFADDLLARGLLMWDGGVVGDGVVVGDESPT